MSDKKPKGVRIIKVIPPAPPASVNKAATTKLNANLGELIVNYTPPSSDDLTKKQVSTAINRASNKNISNLLSKHSIEDVRACLEQLDAMKTVPVVTKKEQTLDEWLTEHGLKREHVPPDGNCFFHSLSLWYKLIAKDRSHAELRKLTTKEMRTPDNMTQLKASISDERYVEILEQTGKILGSSKEEINNMYIAIKLNKNISKITPKNMAKAKKDLTKENREILTDLYKHAQEEKERAVTNADKASIVLSQINKLAKDGIWNVDIGDTVPVMASRALKIKIDIYEWSNSKMTIKKVIPFDIGSIPNEIARRRAEENLQKRLENVPLVNILYTGKGHYDLILPLGVNVPSNNNNNSNNSNTNSSNSRGGARTRKRKYSSKRFSRKRSNV